ncbi:hypothetical protein JCM10908_002551 [Rhodotorula pacifica]|uniref:uncharacterized protein n=1 Tax=Rhodotorula pacifica TaxID=1495444 RepID=UPI0031798144
MPLEAQSVDELLRGSYHLSNYDQYDLGPLPQAQALLSDAVSALTLHYECKSHGVRLGLAWEGLPFDGDERIRVREVDIQITDNTGTNILFHARHRCFPPIRSGLMWGAKIIDPAWKFLIVTVTVQPARSLDSSEAQLACAKTVKAHSLAQVPQDVCFVFVGTDFKLWASSDSLAKESDYFRKLLTGDFNESTVISRSVSGNEEEASIQQHRDFSDSDDETDEQTQSGPQSSAGKADTAYPHKRVIVRDTAYTTYLAVFVWIGSRHIRFARLASSTKHKPAAPESDALPISAMAETDLQDPLLPAPASPKSVYRLAHLLELKQLEELALDNLRSQLSDHNAAYELFSDVASFYPAVRDVALEYVVQHWTAVRASNAWAEMRQLADAHALPGGAAHTAFLLGEKLRP